MPAITLNEVNALTDFIKEDKNKLVEIMGPESSGKFQLTDSATALHSFDIIQKSDILPYTEKKVASELLGKVPRSGKVVSKKVNAKLGITDYILSNGIQVTIKKTDFKSVSFRSVSSSMCLVPIINK